VPTVVCPAILQCSYRILLCELSCLSSDRPFTRDSLRESLSLPTAWSASGLAGAHLTARHENTATRGTTRLHPGHTRHKDDPHYSCDLAHAELPGKVRHSLSKIQIKHRRFSNGNQAWSQELKLLVVAKRFRRTRSNPGSGRAGAEGDDARHEHRHDRASACRELEFKNGDVVELVGIADTRTSLAPRSGRTIETLW